MIIAFDTQIAGQSIIIIHDSNNNEKEMICSNRMHKNGTKKVTTLSQCSNQWTCIPDVEVDDLWLSAGCSWIVEGRASKPSIAFATCWLNNEPPFTLAPNTNGNSSSHTTHHQ